MYLHYGVNPSLLPQCLEAAGVCFGDLKSSKASDDSGGYLHNSTNCSVKEKKLYTGVKVKASLVRKCQVLIASAISYLLLFRVYAEIMCNCLISSNL